MNAILYYVSNVSGQGSLLHFSANFDLCILSIPSHLANASKSVICMLSVLWAEVARKCTVRWNCRLDFLVLLTILFCRKVLAVILGLFQFLFAKILPFLLQGLSLNECKCEGRFDQFSTTALCEVFYNSSFQSKAIAYCSDLSFNWCVYSCTYTLLQKSFEVSHYMNLTAFIRRIWSEFERKIYY